MNLFVAKLSSSTTDDDLQELFSKHGEVTSAKVIIDRETGNSKGFGFVEMADEGEGQAAIEALNDSELDGNQIVVKKANPRNENRSGGGQRRDGSQSRGGYQRRDDRRGGGGGRDDNRGRSGGGGYGGGG
ncbi:MAG: RNA-binding protein, partial [Prolixibacteraceae bacterium]|nr:RNA-binding protein [Prolixibacteraceae bacterium]